MCAKLFSAIVYDALNTIRKKLEHENLIQKKIAFILMCGDGPPMLFGQKWGGTVPPQKICGGTRPPRSLRP